MRFLPSTYEATLSSSSLVPKPILKPQLPRRARAARPVAEGATTHSLPSASELEEELFVTPAIVHDEHHAPAQNEHDAASADSEKHNTTRAALSPVQAALAPAEVARAVAAGSCPQSRDGAID